MRNGFARRPKVLCVDDDLYLTDLLCYVLRREGFSMQVVGSGAQALQATDIDPPDVVLLDAGLLDRDVHDLCKCLRRTYHVPVLVMTAHSADAQAHKGFDLGADAYLTKPFSIEVLAHRLHAVTRCETPAGRVYPTDNWQYRFGRASLKAKHHVIGTPTGSIGNAV